MSGAGAPVADRVAIAGLGTTEFTRHGAETSVEGLALRACLAALADAGLAPSDVDGLCSSVVTPQYLQHGLGIDECGWWSNPSWPLAFQVIEAMNAVFAGACQVALACHVAYRMPARSASARQDPFRRRAERRHAPPEAAQGDPFDGLAGYAAWAGRYLKDFGVGREVFGLIAVNSRSNARRNEHAVLRSGLGLEEYLADPLIAPPFGRLDMDLAVDGADAIVITSAERAAGLAQPPVLIHAATTGQQRRHSGVHTAGLHHSGQSVTMRRLWAKSELALADVDLFYPYDGFTSIAVGWLENAGYCGPGEAVDFMRANWSAARGRLEIGGRVLVNTHGGSLSEGATQGTGHIREAATQLRGAAGRRQSASAGTALVAVGGLFVNSGAIILRRP